MNSLRRKDGIHPTLSPREIVTGKKFCVPRNEIDDYVQAHTLCKNNNGATIEQTVDAPYLGTSDDNDGNDVFTLSTRHKISVNKISMIPITTDIIDKVNNIEKYENQ